MSTTPRLDALLATCSSPRIRAYREEMIRRRAAAAGLDVESYVIESKRAAAATRDCYLLRFDRDAQKEVLARRAATRGSLFTWSEA